MALGGWTGARWRVAIGLIYFNDSSFFSSLDEGFRRAAAQLNLLPLLRGLAVALPYRLRSGWMSQRLFDYYCASSSSFSL